MILTIIALILLYKMHKSDSRASNIIKTFGILDLVSSWGLVIFVFIISLLFIYPQGMQNLINILTLKNGINEFLVMLSFILLGIFSIIHLVFHIRKLLKLKMPLIKTLFMHLIIGITFMFYIPLYYIINCPFKSDKDDDEKFYTNDYTSNANANFTSYTDFLGNTTYYDKTGKKIGSSYTDMFGKTTYYDSTGKMTGNSYTDIFGETKYK